jgi:cation:H+ antiporter
MTMTICFLIVGLFAAAAGGEFLVRGAIGIAQWLRMPARLVGCTVAAFATSSPELSVAVKSAMAGIPEISLGDALGSNVVNAGLVLGLAMLIKPIKVTDKAFTGDFIVAILATLVIIVLSLDVELDRKDGIILLVMFAAWLGHSAWKAYRESKSKPAVVIPYTKKEIAFNFLYSVIGLFLLVLAGYFIVLSAKGIGAALGWSEFIVGATLVAFGTSMPELITTLLTQWKGEDEIGLGNIIGSTIFNSLFIVSVAAIIHPIIFSFDSLALSLVFGILLLVMAVPFKTELLSRRRGLLLLMTYIIYLTLLISRG